MKDEKEIEIRMNAHGVPDVDYYVAKAHELRNEAMKAGFRAFKTWLFEKFERSPAPVENEAQPGQQAAHSDWPWVDLILQGTPDRTRHA